MAFGIFPAFCLFLGTVYPSYASFKALESPDANDDKQWLTYWTIFSAIVVFESTLTIFTYIWGYYIVKTAVLLWLIAPQTQGAKKVYDDIVRPLLMQHASKIDPIFNAGTLALKFPVTGMVAKMVEKQGPGAATSLANVVFNGKMGGQLAQLAAKSPALLEKVLEQALAMANTAK